jgi:hypothetical protein
LGLVIYAAVAESYLHWFLNSKVVKQIKKYPGHESWIAIPTEAIVRMEANGNANDFIKLSRQRKVGLLTVNRVGAVNIMNEPEHIEPIKDILNLYLGAEKIRKALISEALLEVMNYQFCNKIVIEKKIAHYNSKAPKVQFVSSEA